MDRQPGRNSRNTPGALGWLYPQHAAPPTPLGEFGHKAHTGSDSAQELSVADIRRILEEAGRVPVERDTLCNEVIRATTATRWQTGRRLQVVN